jgi:diguanylate cyclase (GGDEF)-like protein/PAS domain S-box-containing protein
MIACAVKTPERTAYLDFGKPYLVNPAVIISSDANGYFGDLNYLKGKRVAVERGYFMQELLQRDYPQITLMTATSVRKALQQVVEGKAEAYVGDAASASYAIKMEGYLHLRFAGQTHYKSIHSVAVTKTNPLLLSIVNKAIAAIPETKKQAIFTHWMGLKIEQGISVSKVSFYAGLVALLFVLFIIWNHWLYNEIKARRLAEQALRDSEAKLLAILDAEPECVKITDAEGRLLQMNHAGLVMIEADHDPASVLGQNVEQLIAEPYRYAFKQMTEKVLNGENGTLVFKINGLKGTQRWVESQAVPLVDTVSKKVNILAVTRDITKRKRAEQREQSRNHVRELLMADKPLKKILTAVIQTFEQDNPPLLASIMLANGNTTALTSHVSPSLPDFYLAEILSTASHLTEKNAPTAIFSDQRQIVSHIQSERRWQNYQALAAQANLAACWSEPIKDSKGQFLGVFALYHSHEASPSADDLQLLQQTAQFIGITIERSRANDEQKIARLVYQNSGEAMTVTDAQGIIITVNHAFTDLTGYTLDEVVGKSTRILSSGKQNQDFYQAMWQAINSTGRWQGEIVNRRKNGKVYTEWLTINSLFNEDGSVDRRVALFSDITHKKESEQLIWKQANFDLLTDLPNRRMFQDRLEQEIKKSYREKLPLALLIIDLDRFKEVNEALGHEIGDILLKKAARRLCACVRESDTVARLGGDEFTVILGDLHALTHIDVIAQSILESFLQPFQLHNEVAYISASIGIAIYPDDAIEVGDLLKSADQAMYAAKNQGRNRYSYFAPFMQEAAKVRMRIATDLRQALKQNEFRLLYQPIVTLKTGKVCKAEALIRWQHPLHGLISPASFIPIAEETDMILKIGNWVFEQAACQVVAWRDNYDAQFQISVNKSPVQFQSVQGNHQAWFAYLGLTH